MNEQQQKAYAEEKATWYMIQCPGIIGRHYESVEKFTKDFILSIIKDCQPKVSRKFLEKWVSKFWQLCCSLPEDIAIDDKERCVLGRLQQMFEEAEVEAEK